MKALVNKEEISKALRSIREVTDFSPKVALILGSGLGDFGARIDATATVRSSEIPFYPVSTVQGHAGKLIFGYLQKDLTRSIPLFVLQGRVHFYETGSLERVIFPVFLAHHLGIKKLIVTNAAGGINSLFTAGDLMLIKDVLNFTFLQSPLITNDNTKHSYYFDFNLQKTALRCAIEQNIPIQQGTYCWLKGPSYETPAEIQMLKRIGADAVGMSTVPEIFAAHKLKIKTVGISLISNMAAGISLTKLSHTEVTETANRVNERFSEFMENLILSTK